MINYLKSEHYRLLRKQSLYVTTLISYLLITATAFILYYSVQIDPNFPYATNNFFYSNVIAGGTLIIIVAFIYNLTLTGKDTSLMKQSISFGISRTTVFWSKLLLTLSYFLLVCVGGMLLMLILGESLMASEEGSVKNFLIASINMLPIVLSGFFLIHTLKMLKISDIYVIVIFLFIYAFSGDVLRLLFRPIAGLRELYKYTPDTLLNQNLMQYMDHAVHLHYEYWITSIVISGIALWIGVVRFKRQDIN